MNGGGAEVGTSLCSDNKEGLRTRAAAVLQQRVLTSCPEEEASGVLCTSAVLSGPWVSINCPEETGGVHTIAAAVPGLGVAINCRRTTADGDRADCEDASLSLGHDESADWGLSSM